MSGFIGLGGAAADGWNAPSILTRTGLMAAAAAPPLADSPPPTRAWV
jgi:hypothetical protein